MNKNGYTLIVEGNIHKTLMFETTFLGKLDKFLLKLFDWIWSFWSRPGEFPKSDRKSILTPKFMVQMLWNSLSCRNFLNAESISAIKIGVTHIRFWEKLLFMIFGVEKIIFRTPKLVKYLTNIWYFVILTTSPQC